MRLRVNTRKATDKLRRAKKSIERNATQGLITSGQMLAKEAMRRTQPFGLDLQAKKKGESSIAKALQILFVPITRKDARKMEAMRLTRARWTLLESGAYVTPQAFIVTSMSSAAAAHKAARDNRGRISSSAEQVAIITSVFRSYYQQIKRRVGFAKSCWAKAIQQAVGKVRAPQWIMRHVTSPGVGAARLKGGKKGITLRSSLRYMAKVFPRGQQIEAMRIARAKFLRYLSYRRAK